MNDYYVNKNTQENGDNEVHVEGRSICQKVKIVNTWESIVTVVVQ